MIRQNKRKVRSSAVLDTCKQPGPSIIGPRRASRIRHGSQRECYCITSPGQAKLSHVCRGIEPLKICPSRAEALLLVGHNQLPYNVVVLIRHGRHGRSAQSQAPRREAKPPADSRVPEPSHPSCSAKVVTIGARSL